MLRWLRLKRECIDFQKLNNLDKQMNKSNNLAVSHIEIFPWNENFDTNIAIIDEQHKKLVSLINTLAKKLVNQANVVELNAIFSELADYTVYHFQTEEAIWHEYFVGDELEASHKKTHNEFIEEIVLLQGEKGQLSEDQIIEDILLFLTRWLAFHILYSDKRMSGIVELMQNGATLKESKNQTDNEMSDATNALIQAVLAMYDNVCNRTVQLMKEIVERQKIEAKQRLASNVFENTLDAICITDKNLNVIEVNPSFCRSKKLSSTDLIGKHLPTLIGQNQPSDSSNQNFPDLKISFKYGVLFEKIWQELETYGYWSGEVYSQVSANTRHPEWLTLSSVKNEYNELTNYVAVFSNVSNLLELKRELEHHAHHDALTGLPNRILLADRLNLALARADRNQGTLAICYLDLDGFKNVNDTLGHAAGDELLKEVARRFTTLLRANDTVARLGGDEFVILFGDLAKVDDYKLLLDRVLHKLNEPMSLGSETVQISASIGVTLYPLDKCSREELLEHADLAMYHAKQSGKSQYQLYEC
jgi:diguanylate cyclase (GGDEF)-like protein/hemerythrin-like metal-binding protein